MRQIEKRREPVELTEWRAANQGDPHGAGINFGYDLLRQEADVSTIVIGSLLAEQGGLCAYTGRRINTTTSHIEHLKPQAHCERGEDVDYRNMVACWPEPNGPTGAFGAHAKGAWPSPEDAAQFVSPLTAGCGRRFNFNTRGEIKVPVGDHAAAQTVKQLKLDHKHLTALRRSTVQGVLGQTWSLSLRDARKRLRSLDAAERALDQGGDVSLDPYCFVVRQVLQKFVDNAERRQRYAAGD